MTPLPPCRRFRAIASHAAIVLLDARCHAYALLLSLIIDATRYAERGDMRYCVER